MTRFEHFEHVIGKIVTVSGHFGGWLIVLMGLLIFVEAVSRYIFNWALMLSDEFAGYILVALAYIGASYTWRQRAHVRITFLVSRLSPKVASWVRLISMVVVFIFLITLLWSTYSFLLMSFRLQMHSSSWLRLPLQGPHITLMIGFTFFALVVILDIVRAMIKIRAGENIEETKTMPGEKEAI